MAGKRKTHMELSAERPDWLKVKLTDQSQVESVQDMMRELRLTTVCEEAKCPNLFECWSDRTATFMLMGEICTRHCGFCSIGKGKPGVLDATEPEHVAEAVERLGLAHAVVTSVDRDDLPDFGAGHFAETIHAIRRRNPNCAIEVLIPDFGGDAAALETVLDARPEVLNHNIETVPRLYRRARPGARYERSLELLQRARERQPDMWVKSGVMVGLGETPEELDSTMLDLHRHGCQMLTVGQYLAPSPESLPVVEYVHPDRFAEIERRGLEIGFDRVFSGPFVRSSYMADVQVPLS
jgi:lipoic acid synthetase